MSAKIYIHPRSAEGIGSACRRFNALGYWLSNTRRGYIEAKPMPRRWPGLAMQSNGLYLPRKQ